MGCSHDCNACSGSCGEPDSLMEQPNPLSSVKRVIGVVSGKGGVGKSLTTSLLAVGMNRKGYHTAILDADITGPSIPKAFGVTGKLAGCEEGIFPQTSETGIDMVSINFLLDNPEDPVIYRGPIVADTVRQFWSSVIWQDVDFMFIDMPPGTSDIPLTVFQSLPVDGIVVMTAPQDLVSMIVTKAVKMAQMMHVPILGIVENYSYLACPDCDRQIELFGKSHVDEVAAAHGLPVLAKLPLDPKLAEAVDRGRIEDVRLPDALGGVLTVLEAMV